jgi:hypothetical protein
MQNLKTNNIYFPLCFLNYLNENDEEENHNSSYITLPDIPSIANKIISYGIVVYAKKLEREWSISQIENIEIDKYIRENKLINSLSNSPLDRFIVLAAMNMGICINNLKQTKLRYKDLENYLARFESDHGMDAKVKIHKDILFEVRDRKFDERMFRVYCGVLSIIGNKPFVRITIKRIMYAMLGCKSEKVFCQFEHGSGLLTARQTKLTIDKLRDRGFFDCITYGKRITFYSTKFREAALQSVVAEAIAKNKLKKEKSKLKSEILNNNIEEKLSLLRSEYLKKQVEKEEESGTLELLRYAGRC